MQTDLQMVIDFHTHLHGFLERGGSNRKNHKLLHMHWISDYQYAFYLLHSITQEHKSDLWNHTCIASLFPACDPPLMTLKAGTGKTKFLLPAMFAICCTRRMTIRKSDTQKQKKYQPKMNDKRKLGWVAGELTMLNEEGCHCCKNYQFHHLF